jgi:hypothetical protein
MLDPNEADYLYQFKKLWDKHIKEPMTKAGIKLQAEEPSDQELVAVAILDQIIDPDEQEPPASP